MKKITIEITKEHIEGAMTTQKIVANVIVSINNTLTKEYTINVKQFNKLPSYTEDLKQNIINLLNKEI